MLYYRCAECGYCYDADMGDPDGGAPAGTMFADLIDNWSCPICGAEKSKFEEEKDDGGF